MSLNVKPVPGCRPEDYAKGLQDLWDARKILFRSELSGDNVENAQGVAKILDRFLQLSSDNPNFALLNRFEACQQGRLQSPIMNVSFELTQLGGQTWEELAEPDWAHFILGWTASDYSGELFSPDRDRLIAYMGWYPEVNGERIRLDTVEWHIEKDFAVLYWKYLSSVHRATFTVDPTDSCWGPMGPDWFRNWHSSTVSWYTHPWDLPGWPSDEADFLVLT